MAQDDTDVPKDPQQAVATSSTRRDGAQHQPPSKAKDDPTVDPRVLEVLVCPETRNPLHFHKDAHVLVSPRPRLAYKILNGVPIMVASEASALDDDDPLLKR